jgi:hypothetical protein
LLSCLKLQQLGERLLQSPGLWQTPALSIGLSFGWPMNRLFIWRVVPIVPALKVFVDPSFCRQLLTINTGCSFYPTPRQEPVAAAYS